MLHAAFVRSPRACAAFLGIDTAQAKRRPGVGPGHDRYGAGQTCDPPWSAPHLLPGMKSAPQYPMAVDRACGSASRWCWWWRKHARRPRTPPDASPSNGRSCRRLRTRRLRCQDACRPSSATTWPTARPSTGDVEAVFAKADLIISRTHSFGRQHRRQPRRSRAVLAAYDKGTGKLTIHTSSQCPAHDPARVRAHAGVARSHGADHGRWGRSARPQDPHLWRRGGGDRGGNRARPPRQIHR